MRVLIGCEKSGTIRRAFRRLGHDAYSCDIQPADDKSKYHIQMDLFEVIREGWWDLLIAHPPCTHLAVSGAKHFSKKKKRQSRGVDFFLKLLNVDIKYVCLENPVSVVSSFIRPPDQIVQPWMFGDSFQKTTCLWLKNLPKLRPTKIVDRGKFVELPGGKKMPEWYSNAKKSDRANIRSKTFDGMANAMAAQWSDPESFVLPPSFGIDVPTQRKK